MTDLPVCTLMHEPSNEIGWDIVPVHFNGVRVFTHVVPCGDLRRHQLDPSCWCNPFMDDDDPLVLGHNSADGREAYEQGKAVS